MLTKSQKAKHIEQTGELLKKSKSLVFADFAGVPTQDINKLKAGLKKAGAAFRVVKKRLLNIVFKNAGIAADPTRYNAQVGTIFIPGELTDAAGMIYKFSKDLAKEKKNFAVLGAYDIAAQSLIAPERFAAIAKLPSREALLAQALGMFTAPLRSFMSIVEQMANRKEPPVANPS